MNRILHIWNDYSPVLFDQTHPICLAKNIDSHLVCGNYINNHTFPLDNTIIYRYRSPKEMGNVGSFWKVYRLVRRLFFWKKFSKFVSVEIKKLAPNILHFHFGNTAGSLINLLETVQIPIVVSYYGVDASALLKDPFWIERYKLVFKHATVVHVLCEEVVERFIKLGCPPEKLIIWNLPPNIESYPLRERTYDGTTRFLIAARFVEKKGHVFLLNAFRQLVNKNIKVHLTLFGYGPTVWLQRLISELDLNDFVTLINNGQSADFTSTFRKMINKHDIFLAPSTIAKNGDDEGGPALTMVCAQAAGMPVIATPFAGAQISLVDGKTGYYCKQDDAISLERIMLDMCGKPDVWQELGRNGSELVKQQFSILGQGRELIQLYKSVLK